MTDPREQLITLGNALLDAVYKEEAFNREHADTIARVKRGDTSVLDEMKDAADGTAGTVEFVLNAIELPLKRKELVGQYYMLRQTIEALTAAPTTTTLEEEKK